MNALGQLLVTVVLVAAGLWAYDALQERAPAGSDGSEALETPALAARLDALEAQLRGIEDRLTSTKDATTPPAAVPEKAGPLDAAELARLEAVVRELRRREEIDRLTTSVRTRVTALGIALTEGERAKAEELLVALEAERADFWREVRQDGLRDPEKVAERFTPIRDRYTQALRAAFAKAQADALIEAYLPE